MNNYEYAHVFERLAIKIVEAQCGYKLNDEKSRTTQATRDYGVDAIIYFADRTPEFSTIEAKLRKPSCTLALKDIASSILFFLVRNGNEHFIVSNVYITSGTIQTIKILNLQSTSKIYYITGEETFEILKNIVDRLQEPQEKKLAQLLIENFQECKKPQNKLIQTNVTHESLDGHNRKELFLSRQEVINSIIEGMQKNHHLITLHGEKNVGKTFLLKRLNSILKPSGYKPIMMDVYKYNTIDVFCYELAQKLLDIDLKEIIHSLSQKHIKNLEHILDNSEKETLNIFEHIFQSEEIPDKTATYLASKYLHALFRKCDNIQYIIELEKFSYTSKELFEFIRDFSIDTPPNVYIICEFSYELSVYHQDFSQQYKEIYSSNIQEINIGGISFDECEIYLKNSLPYIDKNLIAQIIQVSKGNPVLLDQAINIIREEVLINADMVINRMLSVQQGRYKQIFSLIKKDILIAKFFLLQYIFSFSLEKSIWEIILDNEGNCMESVLKLSSPILSTDLFETNEELYVCKDFGLLHKLETYFEENFILYIEISRDLQKYLCIVCQEELCALAEIKLLFLTDDCSITDKYENKKDLWMYRSNITWQKQSLKLICRFYLHRKKTEEDISGLLEAIHYYLSYLDIVTFMGEFENNLHKKIINYKSALEDEYSKISDTLLFKMADTLADIYIYEYQFLRETSSFEKELNLLKKCIHKEWFQFIPELKKIKILRYQALSYKSVGDRETYNNKLSNIYNMYMDNSYAELIYWANKAAPFYVKSPKKAQDYLKKCNLEKFLKDYAQEVNLYLWIKNDMAIISFYNQNLNQAEEILEDVLEKSVKLNYSENIARTHNLLGAIALKRNDIELATKEFFRAFTVCADVAGEAFFHFVVNYIVITEDYDEKIIVLILKYIRTNKNRLIEIFKTQKLDTCRWFVTLYAFYNYLKKKNPALSKEVEFPFSPWLSETPPYILKDYFINGKLIVLF